jgi:hypothetical protein
MWAVETQPGKAVAWCFGGVHLKTFTWGGGGGEEEGVRRMRVRVRVGGSSHQLMIREGE